MRDNGQHTRARRRRRGAGAAFAALLLIASAGCKSSDSSSGSTSTTSKSSSTGEVTKDDRAPGVTAATIKVGVTYPDLGALKDVIKIDNGDFEKAYQAVVDDINANGGIEGRKLEVVFAPINPTGANAFAAACTKLTQDQKVFVAVGFFLGDDINCYLQTNPTPVIGGTMTAELLEKAKVAWYSTDPGDDLQVSIIRTLAEQGKLDGKVAVYGSAEDQKGLEETISPLLKELKVDVVDTALNDAPATDANAGIAQAQTIAERFKSKGADQVLVIGPSASVGFLNGLVKTDYHPELRFSVLNSLAAYTSAAGSELSSLKGALSGGTYDGQNKFGSLGGSTKECVDVMEKAGMTLKPANSVPEGEPRQVVASSNACIQLGLLQAILEKAGKDLNFGTYKTAGDSLGKVDLPFSPSPWDFGAPPKADGNPKTYVYAWDPSSKAFQQAD